MSIPLISTDHILYITVLYTVHFHGKFLSPFRPSDERPHLDTRQKLSEEPRILFGVGDVLPLLEDAALPTWDHPWLKWGAWLI